jgi:hypothetical protein
MVRARDVKEALLRKIPVLLTMLLVAPAAAANTVDAFVTGNRLHDLCKADRGDCTAYALGVIDAINAAHAVPLCIPDKVVGEQVRDLVARWLNDHPERRQGPAAELVFSAISAAFPCKPAG